jgi:hypothetical protein
MRGKLGLCRHLREDQAGEVESTPREPLRLPGGATPARAPPRPSQGKANGTMTPIFADGHKAFTHFLQTTNYKHAPTGCLHMAA